MNAAELMRRVIAYGADKNGIDDRFGNNTELYKLCFLSMFEEECFITLQTCIETKDYEHAFEPAHAIKGLTSNLGVKPFYAAICELVEDLRAKRYDHADEKYAEVQRQYEILRKLSDDDAQENDISTEQNTSENSSETSINTNKDKEENNASRILIQKDKPQEKVKKIEKQTLYLPIILLVSLFVILGVFSLFNNIISDYEGSVLLESADHLSEINYQIKSSVESSIENDWKIANTVSVFISDNAGSAEKSDIVNLLSSVKDVWGLSDVALYTEDCYGISASSIVENKDIITERVFSTHESDRCLSIVESRITFTVPIKTELQYNGSDVVAISISKDMSSFLDDMDISSFSNNAYMFLTDSSGVVISRLSNGNGLSTFNVMTLIGDRFVKSVRYEDVTSADILTVKTPTVFLLDDIYVVSTPISTYGDDLRIIYFAPESIVNKTAKDFTDSIILASLVITALIFLISISVFLFIYNNRKKRFNAELLARERMFDLLVRKSRTAFGLFRLGNSEPLFISSNLHTVTGLSQPSLIINGDDFEIHSFFKDGDRLTPIVFCLRDWDGKSEYTSGYLKNKDSENPKYYELQMIPTNEELGEYLGVAQDVTLLYNRETVTRDALVMAERSSEAKTNFLSNMSHDIRTPMNAIVNMADFAIEDMADPDKLREHLKTIRQSSDHLLMLINDILDMTRIESGKSLTEVQPFDLMIELDRLTGITKSLCDAKNLALISDFSGITTSTIIGDRVKVSQVLMNLLSNAVKFTPNNGAVRFVANEVQSMREEYVCMRFTVEDTGIGMSKELMEHVFEPFVREDTKRVSGIQGTGLGLAICHTYVNEMGGAIKCDSIEGEGSTFTVELIFKKAEGSAVIEKQDYSSWDVLPFAGLRCLLCEDNATNRRIGKTILERLGFTVDTAEDGREGVSKFKLSDIGYYNMIYMDIQMPIMDGYEAAVVIRSLEREDAASVPIIAMTANVFIEDIEKAHIAGMDGHVGKPINTVALSNETKSVIIGKRKKQE